MERYRYAEIVQSVLSSKAHLPPNRPIHLFGCGHPMFFAQAAFLGCDLFDSASYAKFAKAGRMMLPSGTVHLDQITENPCSCPVCSAHSAEDLKSLPREKRDLELMRHNLFVAAAEMRLVRQAITENKLFELVAQRARNHPSLLDALQATMGYSEVIARNDMIGKTSSIFYTGPETLKRPEVVTFHQRIIDRYPYTHTEDLVVVPDDARRPFYDTSHTIIQTVRKTSPTQALLLFLTPMGVVPWELEHVHPAQQCIFPDLLHQEVLRTARSKLSDILDLVEYHRLLWFEKPTSLDSLDNMEDLEVTKAESASKLIELIPTETEPREDWNRRKLRAVLAFQWGREAASLADLDGLNFDISRATGKIRHVREDEDLLFTMVPTTGLLTPTFTGGERLLKTGLDKRYIVIIDDEVSEFVEDGKSALAKFVKESSSNLRAGEEVLVTDQQNCLLGVGRAILTGKEMLGFDRGVAVNIRHSKKN
jgi:7-cyano-7-deazaguanine tRNA-ribosyltransferase